MIQLIKKLIVRYKELIIYGIFGVCTTVVNFVTYKLCNMAMGVEYYLVSNVIAWFFSVVFAYITNKLFVFESKSWEPKLVTKEVSSFFAARVFSFLIEEAGLFCFVDLMGMKSFSFEVMGFTVSGNMISKVIVGVVVVIINYFLSKLIIFKKKNKTE